MFHQTAYIQAWHEAFVVQIGFAVAERLNFYCEQLELYHIVIELLENSFCYQTLVAWNCPAEAVRSRSRIHNFSIPQAQLLQGEPTGILFEYKQENKSFLLMFPDGS